MLKLNNLALCVLATDTIAGPPCMWSTLPASTELLSKKAQERAITQSQKTVCS